jgi:pimeloyl-ACP methyl ester carboxylesterase
MKNLRTRGKPPYKVVVVHGGPGAPGSIAPVARELAKDMGILEPLQTKNSIDGQVEELAGVLKKNADIPAVLIGHSWGAWLVYLVAARHPSLVKKIIMVGSGSFVQKYADNMFTERLDRLSEKDRVKVLETIEIIRNPATKEKDKNVSFARFGDLMAKADTFAPLPPEPDPEPLPASEEINRKVWEEAVLLRISGELLEMGRQIKCPVIAIHGDYETHSAEGVKGPLAGILKDFRFILLGKCGHEPWLEKYARDEFYRVLREEVV